MVISRWPAHKAALVASPVHISILCMTQFIWYRHNTLLAPVELLDDPRGLVVLHAVVALLLLAPVVKYGKYVVCVFKSQLCEKKISKVARF